MRQVRPSEAGASGFETRLAYWTKTRA